MSPYNTFLFFSYTFLGSDTMNPVIGIVMRPEINKKGRNILALYKEVSNAIFTYGGNVIAIVPPHLDTLTEIEKQNLYQVIDLCDGIVLEGGIDFYDYDIAITKYIYEKNIPTLGICLGMQTMASLFGGTLLDFASDDHNKPGKLYVHDIKIIESSKLHEILGKKQIFVNSRHKSYIENTNLFVSARNGSIIEAVEDPHKKFFIGVQYHPEDMITYDTVEARLFQKFIETCRGD